MKKGMAKKAVSVFIAVILLLCPLSFCFASDEVQYDLTQVDGFYILAAGLQSCGITVRSDDQADAWNWLEDAFETFCDQTGRVFDSIFQTVKVGANKAGEILIDNVFVDIIDDFGGWLKSTFGLNNNDTITVVSPGSNLNGITVYQLPIAFTCSTGSSYYDYELTVLTAPANTYCVFERAGNTSRYVLFNNSGGTVNEQKSNRYGTNNNTRTLGTGSYFGFDYYYSGSQFIADPTGYSIYTYQEILDASNGTGGVVSSGVSVYIDTLNINLPSDDPNYSADDGGIIDIDAPWLSSLAEIIVWIIQHYLGNKFEIAYELIKDIIEQLDNTVMVENLPAIVSTQSIGNPGLSDVFLPLKGFINTFSDGFGLMTQIVYNMPTPVLGMALAIMSAIAVFGVIRILKEH